MQEPGIAALQCDGGHVGMVAARFPLEEPDHGVPARIQQKHAAREQQIYGVLIAPAEPMRVVEHKLRCPLAEPFAAQGGEVKQQHA